MTLLLALRSLTARPLRTAVLAAGFGLGVAVMAVLLGVAEVILEQARAPELVGGGDVIIDGAAGRLPNGKFTLSSLLTGPLARRVAAATPIERATLYLIDEHGATAVRARGGVPSLERAMGDPETSGVTPWTDTAADQAWAMPRPEDVLFELDRFHRIPTVDARADSWAEWLYFNGRARAAAPEGQRQRTPDGAAFYLTFLAGPRLSSGRRQLGARLQLEEGGRMTSYSESVEIDEEALLEAAPNLTVGRNHVRLAGHEYRIGIDLPAESGRARARGELVLRATPHHVLPPLALRGAGGWISGYVVPAMSGSWQGRVTVQGRTINFDGATGYHDHNWGFWEGVSWQWGQVQGSGMSFVYGRIRPPSDVADPHRVPAFLMALGPDGPIGHSTNVTITETDRADAHAPGRIVVRGESDALEITIDLSSIQSTVRSRFGDLTHLDFLQMRAEAHVSGRVGERPFNFTAPASAETFRARQ